MWNAVIAFEGSQQEDDKKKALVQLRHVAADCMYMATTVLGGISARYNIDELSLLKFYTACGQKYSTDIGDMDMADVCFSKGTEFVEKAFTESRTDACKRKTFARAMFDLLLGKAECAWEKGESDDAERFVSDARQYMDDLPGEHEFLASVEYNFGLFTYQAKETERALKWLKKSMETRGSDANTSKNVKKQAKTARLAGVCLLALQDYGGSWKLMNEAEEMCHDPVGSYLLLKLSVITKNPQAIDILIKTVQDPDNSIDICIASIALFGDAQRISDAAVGFEHLYVRFRDTPKAIAGAVGMRYFETLTALGKVEKALEVLEDCCTAIAQLRDDNAQELGNSKDDLPDDETSVKVLSGRWSAMLLAIGSAQADRKDFHSAAILLNRCLLLARNVFENIADDRILTGKAASEESSVVLENESAVCKLVSSCALCAIDGLRKRNTTILKMNDTSRGDGRTQGSAYDSLLEMASSNAERAKLLDSNDFAPRLLLFRAHLIMNEYEKAANELKKASEEISSFDPGALAEAACAARDVGSQESVVAALRCILNMNPTSLSKKLGSSSNFPKGFYGKVLLSCINILRRGEAKNAVNKEDTSDSGSEVVRNEATETQEDELLSVLKAGLRGIQELGPAQSFDDEKERAQESLSYLVNICWNIGRKVGTAMSYAKWEAFFDLCYQFSKFLSSDPETLQTKRMSMLMCASANVENSISTTEDFQKARKQVQEARNLSEELQQVAPTTGEDPIEGLLLILESRCCVGSKDIDSLACVVQTALQKTQVGAGVLEQLAAVCHNFDIDVHGGTSTDASETRLRCADLVAALLAKASDVRLCKGTGELSALAVTMREHLSVELSRGSTAARAYGVFSKATGVVLEHADDFPLDERRWLVAIAWDRAQMFHRVGQNSEAKRWCQGAQKLVEGCIALSSYSPRLASLLQKLSS